MKRHAWSGLGRALATLCSFLVFAFAVTSGAISAPAQSGEDGLLRLGLHHGTSGNLEVTITGEGFSATSSVTFDGLPAASQRVLNPRTIVATLPSGVTRAEQTVVTSPDGKHASTNTVITTSKMLAINNENWHSRFVATNSSPDVVTVYKPGCHGLGTSSDTINLLVGGSRAVDSFGDCAGAPAVQLLEVSYVGAVDLWTEAEFRDGAGSVTFVTIPPLVSIAPGVDDYFDFKGIERVLDAKSPVSPRPIGRDTFFLLFGDGAPLAANLKLFDGENKSLDKPLGNLTGVDVDLTGVGYAWYEITPLVDVGRAEVRVRSTFGCGGCPTGKLYAVAFVGYRSSGGPRVEMPTLRHTASF